MASAIYEIVKGKRRHVIRLTADERDAYRASGWTVTLHNLVAR